MYDAMRREAPPGRSESGAAARSPLKTARKRTRTAETQSRLSRTARDNKEAHAHRGRKRLAHRARHRQFSGRSEPLSGRPAGRVSGARKRIHMEKIGFFEKKVAKQRKNSYD